METEYKDARTAAQRRFVRAEAALKNAFMEGDIPIKLIEQRYSEVKQQWRELQVVHDDYIIGVEGAEEGSITKEDESINEFASRFSEIEIGVYRKMRDASAVTSADSISAVKQRPMIKLESLKFPIFDGNVRIIQSSSLSSKSISNQCVGLISCR